MSTIARHSQWQPGSSQRWRCGTCLFELPERITPNSSDLPPNHDFSDELEAMDDSLFSTHEPLEPSAMRDCIVCSSLLKAIRKWTRPAGGGDNRQDIYCSWARGALVASDGLDDEFYIQTFMRESSVYPPDLHPFIQKAGSPSGDTRSPDAFKKVEKWIDRCRNEHQHCKKFDKRAGMPTRILFIEDITSMKVRLVENDAGRPPQPYICLSHRWTSETRTSSLTKGQAQVFQKEIPKEYFYPLLMEALETTHRLGFRYLWVDCMCIFQDDLQDWHSQASEMAMIYENAALTISATASSPESDSRGLFYQQVPDEILELKLDGGPIINFRFLSDCNLHPLISDSMISDPSKPTLTDFPLLRRGWTYQERLLSNRIIHFTKREIIWECKEAIWCECQFREQFLSQQKSLAPRICDMKWTDIVVDYAETDLSFESDRLPALSGIAKRFGEHHGWTYLAGLWLEDLVAHLMWRVESRASNGIVVNRPRPSSLPSWSWASVVGPLFFLSCSEPLIRLISHDIEPGANPFGNPVSAKLVLEGPCMLTTLFYSSQALPERDDVPILKIGNDYLLVWADYSFTEFKDDILASGREVLFMVQEIKDDFIYGLALICTDRPRSCYERIGIVQILGPHYVVTRNKFRREEVEKNLINTRITLM